MADLPVGYQLESGASGLPQGYQLDSAAASSPSINIPSAAGNTNTGLTPEQFRDYQQHLQATPLDASFHEQSTPEAIRQGIAGPFAGTAAMATHLLAGKVGDINTGAGQSLDALAHSIQDTNQNHQPGLVSGATGLVTGAAGLVIPGGAVAMGVNDASNTILSQIRNEEDNGASFDESLVKRALIGGGVQTAINLLMAHGLTSDAATNIINRLAPTVGKLPAAVATRAVVGGGLQMAGQGAQNYENGRPLTEGMMPAAATGGLQEVLGGTFHDAMSHTPESTVPTQPTPAAVPETVIQAETPAQSPSSDSQFGPLHPDVTKPTVFTARSEALQRASVLKQDMYITPADEGGYRITSQQPDNGWSVNPNGKITPLSGAEPAISDRAQTDMPQNAAAKTPATPELAEAPIASQRANGELPPTLNDAKSVGEWYGKTFNDQKNAGTIESLASTHDGAYVLKDVPVDQLSSNDLTGDETNQAKVDKFAKMSADTAKPVIAGQNGDIFDGGHRLAAAIQRGDETIKAYVPDTFETKEPSLAGRFLSDESGGTSALKNVAEQSILPKVREVAGDTSKTLDTVNRVLGTGLAGGTEGKRIRSGLREATGLSDLDRVRAQEEIKPYRDTLKKMSPQDQAAWVDQAEKTGKSTVPALQPYADTLRRWAAENKTDAGKLGMDTTGWNPNYIGARMAEWPDNAGGGKRSIAGAESYLKNRTLDKYSDFVNAVEGSGGKLKYDNVADATLAKQIEVRRSIQARQLVQREMSRGSIRELAAGETIKPGEKFLDDKLSTPGHRLVANEPIANELNQFISPGLSDTPLIDHMIDMKRNSAALNFALSAFHGGNTIMGKGSLEMGKAIENVAHGEFQQARYNAARALTGVTDLGSELRKQARDPSFDPKLEPVVQAMAKLGHDFGIRSLLQPTDFETAAKSFKNENPIAGVYHGVKGILNAMAAPIMDHYVPNAKAQASGLWISDMIKRGESLDDIHANLQKVNDAVDHFLGETVRKNQFQHKIVQQVMDAVFTAPKYMEGAVRQVGAVGRDSVQAIRDIASGKKARITPAMYATLGYVTQKVLVANLMQGAYTAVTTGKPQLTTSLKDIWYPRTGRKNDDGSDERVVTPDPMAALASLALEGPKRTLLNRVFPLYRAIAESVENKDYRNKPVEDRTASVTKQIGEGAGHVGKSLLPFSVTSAAGVGQDKGPSTDFKVGAFVGLRKAPSGVTTEPKEPSFRSEHDKAQRRARQERLAVE